MVTVRKTDRWTRLRSLINHDCLRNRLLLLLRGLVDVASGEVTDPGFLAEAGERLAMEWECQRPRLDELLSLAPAFLAPSRLLESRPWEEFPWDLRTQIGEIVDTCWRYRTSVMERLGAVRQLLSDADVAVSELVAALAAVDASERALKEIAPLVDRGYEAVHRLSQGISSLPSGVEVT